MQNIRLIEVCAALMKDLEPYWFPEFEPEKVPEQDKLKAVNICNKMYNRIKEIKDLTQMSLIKDVQYSNVPALRKKSLSAERGNLIRIKPADIQYGNKTYLGFFLGDIALASTIKVENSKISCEFTRFNPAIYVPELGEVIYGLESWWSVIKTLDDFADITNEEIENVWYIKLAKEMFLKEHPEEKKEERPDEINSPADEIVMSSEKASEEPES